VTLQESFRRYPIPWLIGLGYLLVGGGAAVFSMTRGFRNNNPGNIRLTSPPTPWQGWVGAAAQTDADFVQFATAEYGIRAMWKVLSNYYAAGYQSVADIVSRYAPSSENDTSAYIASVASRLGVDPAAILDFTDPATQTGLVAAMVTQEQGINPYSDDTIAQGIAAA
jgi:hypothetical protein